jgi:pyruvate dehydrogenase E2 component (dihydrolipoamide acetyltransferase)
MFGIDQFTAILNPPQVAILAAGRVERRFVPDAGGNPVARPLMTLTLSADHRAIDGAVAARFLATLRAALEEPARMLL